MKLDSFWTDFRKILKNQISLKKRPMGADMFHADRRSDK